MVKKLCGYLMMSSALLFSCFLTNVHATDSDKKENTEDVVTDNKSDKDKEDEKSEVLPPDGVLNITSHIDKRWEVPLTVDADKPVFYFNANINPGDILDAKIIFSNPTKEPVQFTISDILNELSENQQSVELLNQLNFKISIDGSPIYEGLASQITMPVMGWLELFPDEKVTLDIRYEVPKDMGNEFQAAKMNLKYELTIRADVPPDPEEEEEWYDEVQTAVKIIKQNPLITVAILLGIGTIGSLAVVYSKKKKNQK